MSCHYIHDNKGRKVLIPECDAVAFTGDIDLCTCSSRLTFQKFEKESYNKHVADLRAEIASLKEENEDLKTIIKKLRKK